jgi:NAD(P)-dependent dehydrogenase (short-subunit alcohol dehydrogenase family)
MNVPTIEELFGLRGKVAIVTGSTKGIGRAVVSGLAAAGASVVVSSRKQDACDRVASEVAAESGGETMGLACHMGDWDFIPRFVDQVRERFGRIDVLVNNAGINPRPTTIGEMTKEYWQKLFTVNTEGPVRMSQCVAPIMRDGGGGSIINISTMGGYHGSPAVSAYCSSKAALMNVSYAMAQEWAPWNIRVNVISPGPFDSEMMQGADNLTPGFIDSVSRSTMLKRLANPQEMIGPVLYLASNASSYVTGDDIAVAGGSAK